MIAYVICCNDSIKAVVLDDEIKAITKMNEMAHDVFTHHKDTWEDYQAYRSACYWHIHDFVVEK